MKRLFTAALFLAPFFLSHGALAQNIVVDACGHVVGFPNFSVPGYSVPGTITQDGKSCVAAPDASPPLAAPSTDKSGTITTGGTFQTIAAANTSRKSFEFQNVCHIAGNCTTVANNCYLFFAASGSPTTAKSKVIGPGQEYLRSEGAVPSDAIQATCDGNSDKFSAAEQ